MPRHRHSRYPYIEFPSREAEEHYAPKGHADWPDNVGRAKRDLRSLLARRVSEQAVHDYLEVHPYLLPGLGTFHHGPFAGIVATKFPLGVSFVTDFAYIASNSQTLCITCVEIESPRKRLFRSDDRFHRDYLDARQQIVDWMQWAREHRREVAKAWGKMFPRSIPDWFDVSFRGFLVFGRRSDISNPMRQERWSAEGSSMPQGLFVMTYDRLMDDDGDGWNDLKDGHISVCSYRDRRFLAKRVIS